jgi:hypothetical protein
MMVLKSWVSGTPDDQLVGSNQSSAMPGSPCQLFVSSAAPLDGHTHMLAIAAMMNAMRNSDLRPQNVELFMCPDCRETLIDR